ncbi:chromosome segregation protein SMC [Thiohalocapsa halophila]|uniref:Chromosome partition protein Smc n=1 Tax=Thiohalocapsa halophila TaxID=69359 RepID=A0ABS1CBC6_9GAMM|nr:chromosome segregation protein SMC [Thiohalocapsa halophila]MBK1629224.1 chromosome segregation protein SMC [Thiohalocapsa halophila]
MRLEKIKLTGFKSFVDATTVPFPSNLVGVVGPNGCGKSNVIDAVRWVMGESSAKMLRGESMADVIFNGSTSRKPVGVAGIELTFDNSSGRAGGEFTRFSEIAVKRQVSRDGQSTYFLNGARCRRRDIQDLFLGTGLGPRSYAIIEQGMISRFIEAKPDELRLFIEEAAGISKYKERRRETENRIRHTRENLDRLDDLRDEVAKQLKHLERQAETAEKYRRLKEDERRLEDELTALRWRELDQELGARERAIAELEVDLERRRAEQRRLEAQIESDRDAHAEASDAFNAVQGRYYSVGAEIARLEQAIRFADENRSRQEAELARVREELAAAEGHRERDTARMAELAAELERDEPALAEVAERLAAAGDELAGAEAQLESWQAAWDALQEGPGGPTERAQTERGRINDLEQRIARADQRAARMAEDREKLDTGNLAAKLEQLKERSDALDEQIAAAADDQARSAESLRQLEEERTAVAGRLDAARTELQTCRGRQASLEALQDAALEQGDDAVGAWIEAQGLGDVPRLVDSIEVDAGWEAAVEAVLDDMLAALCIADLDTHGPQLDCGPLGLLGPGLRQDPDLPDPQGDSLAARVRSPWPLHGLLHGIRTTNTLAEALSRRGELAPGERIVTRDGAQVGRDWLTRPGDGPRVAGTLARAETLRALQAESDELDGVINELVERHDDLAERRQSMEQARDDALDTVSRLSRDRATLDAEVGAGRSRLEHMRERISVLDEELRELTEARAEAAEDIEASRERLHQALEETERLSTEREALGTRRDALRARVAEARASEAGLRDERQRLEVAIQTRRASLEALEAQLGRAGEQLTTLGARRDELLAALTEAAEPVAEQREQLEAQLEQRVAVEAELGAARERMEALDQSVREAEQARHALEQGVASVQQDLDAKRLERQERLVRRRTLEEQLAERGGVMAEIVAALDPAAGSGEHETALGQVKSRIERLGNINLAAIDEFREQSERMRYLDEQHADISDSLETLEAAIRKIDRETRARFQDTFDRINQGLQQLFPRVFGGGHAYLELTGDDLLDTGVAIMARPPGKRNASIHLLSGGEKALTAVALVFAIFQLNPAPFCMLDEVDAPLDDANVGRFCELVRSLSDQVQFIFITHNKVTMEIADHLIGVTMHEPGVSRLVSVDVDEAAKLAAVS